MIMMIAIAFITYVIELCFTMIFISNFLFFIYFSRWQLPTFNELSESTDVRSLTFAIKEQEANLETSENENVGP